MRAPSKTFAALLPYLWGWIDKAVTAVCRINHAPAKDTIPPDKLALPMLPLVLGNFAQNLLSGLEAECEQLPKPMRLAATVAGQLPVVLQEATARVIGLADIDVQVAGSRVAECV